MVKFERCLGFAAAGVGLWGALTGCGSDGGGGKAESYSSITEAMNKPTGTVSENAPSSSASAATSGRAPGPDVKARTAPGTGSPSRVRTLPFTTGIYAFQLTMLL